MSDDTETTTRGGKREGAGRPPGSRNTLPTGTVRALKAQRLRVPADASPEAAEVAGRALERLVDVLEGRVRSHKALATLKAVAMVREEVCGPIEKKLRVSGAMSVAVVDPYAVDPAQQEAPAPATSPLEVEA
jgi:hypothetical protein